MSGSRTERTARPESRGFGFSLQSVRNSDPNNHKYYASEFLFLSRVQALAGFCEIPIKFHESGEKTRCILSILRLTNFERCKSGFMIHSWTTCEFVQNFTSQDRSLNAAWACNISSRHILSASSSFCEIISAGHRKFFFKSAVRKSATEFQVSKSETASRQLHV